MDFISKLANGLGLCSCRTDWAKYLADVPPDLSSAAGVLSMWLIVSERLNTDVRRSAGVVVRR
jgi:hypothetical protein